MKKLSFLIIVLVFTVLAIPTRTMAQSGISGQIISGADGKPISNATISILDKGTISDLNGKFQLFGYTSDSVSISVSFIGFQRFIYKTSLKPGENKLPVFTLSPIAINMDEFVITATRTDNRMLNTPVRVNLISPKMLNSVPMQNIDEVLKYAPGINYSRPFGIFSTKGIVTMRGMSGKEQGRVLVLVDGVPINKSDGGTVDWNMIDMNSVQKIEITKGAGSAVYGGNAMGGIINFITKTPDKKLFLIASLEYGTFNTMGGRLNAGGKINLKQPANSLYWQANLSAKKSDGYITQSDADVKANPYIVKSNMQEAGLNFKTGFSFSDKHNLEATVNYYNDRWWWWCRARSPAVRPGSRPPRRAPQPRRRPGSRPWSAPSPGARYHRRR